MTGRVWRCADCGGRTYPLPVVSHAVYHGCPRCGHAEDHIDPHNGCDGCATSPPGPCVGSTFAAIEAETNPGPEDDQPADGTAPARDETTSFWLVNFPPRLADLSGAESDRPCAVCGRSLWQMTSGRLSWLCCPLHCERDEFPWLAQVSDTYSVSEG